MKPRALDAFCCSGGTGVGLARAGFDVTGIDIRPRPDYPFECLEGDAVPFIRDHGHRFALIVAGPPCQAHSTLTQGNLRRSRVIDGGHVSLIAETRAALETTGRPWIIENVVGARPHLRAPVMLCGLSFGLNVFRHRLFESNVRLDVPAHPSHRGHRVSGWRHGVNHPGDMVAVYGEGGGKGSVDQWRDAMGIDWTRDRESLREAIPPAYSEHLARQFR